MDDKGDEGDPQSAVRSQAGHPVPANHGSCQHQRWEPGKLHSEPGENKDLRPGRKSPGFDAATGRRTNQGSVSPAYGDISLALVKNSNEGGPGPSYNMKEVPESTLIMLAVHAYPEPFSWEAGGNQRGGPPHSSEQAGQGPLPPPSRTYSTPCKDADRDQARWKSHFSL